MVTHHVHCVMDYIVYIDTQIDIHYKEALFVQVTYWTHDNTVDKYGIQLSYLS